MPPVPVTVSVVTDDAVPVPVDGVVVRAYTDPGDVFVTENTTDLSGEAELTLDSGADYLFRAEKAGTSFAGSPFSLSVLDPPAVNELEIEAHVGETALVVQLVLKDSVGDPIDGVKARLYSAADLFLTEGVTGDVTPGVVDFPLEGAADPGQDYIVRWRPPEEHTIQGGNTRVISVLDPLVPPATNIFDFIAEKAELPESDDETMCLLSGYLSNVSRTAIKEGKIVFLPRLRDPDFKVSGFPFPTEPSVLGRDMLVSESSALSDDNGYVEIKLPRTSILDVHIYGLETPGLEIVPQVYIPNRAGAKLEDVLLPYLSSVDTESGSAALSVGETLELSLTAVGSNDQPDLEFCVGLFEIESSDEDVVSLEFRDGVLKLTAVGAGAATVTVSRKDDTFAPRVPDIPDLIVTPDPEITVTVT
jgi:hypothetical protein